MDLETRLTDDLKTAMKNRDAVRLETLRQVKSRLKYYQIEKKLEKITNEDILHVIERMVKQRAESISQYEKGNRPDLVEKEQAERAVLAGYLPEPLSAEELEKVIHDAIQETGAREPRDIGRVMKAVMPRVTGRADGKTVNREVQRMLK
jgi:hypothetical protein